MRPQSIVGFGEHIYKLENANKATIKTPTEARVMRAHTSKRPDEREFVVDSGASMHMMSKQEIRSDDMEIFRRSRNATVVLTTNREVHTCEETQVFVHVLNLFVSVQFLEETPAVLSLEKTLRRPRILL